MSSPGSDDDQLGNRLRAADPAASLDPADHDLVARLLEDAMSSDTDHDLMTRETGLRDRGPLAWLVAAAAVLLIAGVGALALVRHGTDRPPPAAGATTVTTLSAPATTTGRCMVPSAERLQAAALAFDGTVVSVQGDAVTLRVSHWYTGQAFDRVRVTASPQRLQDLIGATDFSRGDRYLVAGSSTDELMVCGFSAPYSAQLASMYADAFAS
jgi:hypothetical protein